MKNFYRVAQGADVMPVMNALMMAEGLWNQNTFRTTYQNTPHINVDDIWLRFSDVSKIGDATDLSKVVNDNGAVWYPAGRALPVKPLVLDLMRRVNAYELGRLLITRIRPGGRILPHADVDGSYVYLGDIARYHVVLQGMPGSLFKCGGETVCMQTGDVWWFNAHQVHEVVNNSQDDRVHMLIDLRLWQ